jgi:hypothetical protein
MWATACHGARIGHTADQLLLVHRASMSGHTRQAKVERLATAHRVEGIPW